MYFENSLRGVRWLWLLPSFGTDPMYDFFLLNSHFVVDWSKLLLLAESNAGEKIAIRVFNHDYRATVNDVLRKLETAQLQRRGFTRTVINETVTTADERPITSTVLHFYKKIPCRQLMYVEEVETFIKCNYITWWEEVRRGGRKETVHDMYMDTNRSWSYRMPSNTLHGVNAWSN